MFCSLLVYSPFLNFMTTLCHAQEFIIIYIMHCSCSSRCSIFLQAQCSFAWLSPRNFVVVCVLFTVVTDKKNQRAYTLKMYKNRSYTLIINVCTCTKIYTTFWVWVPQFYSFYYRRAKKSYIKHPNQHWYFKSCNRLFEEF
jgi:hypothetical protein